LKKARIAASIAFVSIAVLAMTGCTTAAPAPTASGGTVRISASDEITGFNFDTPAGNLVVNLQFQQYTRSGFYYLDNKLNVVPDKSFGTVEKISDSPLVVKYTLNKDLLWSDGQPITADDMMLAWAAQSGYYDDATMNAKGDKAVSGTKYFTYGGGLTSLSLTKLPKVGDDNRSITLSYTEPYADWQIVNPIGEPAHVVAKHAGIKTDALMKAFTSTPKGDRANPAPANATIKAAADFWNTGFNATSLPSDKDLYLSSSAMVLDSWTPGQSYTLVKNKNYKGDLKPKVDKIVVRTIKDPQAAVSALKNGEVDIISPTASADTISALKALPNVSLQTGNQYGFVHLDLTMNSPVFKDKNVREAFLKTVPRQQILDGIVKPANAKAEVYNSQLFFPGDDGYKASAAGNGSSAYDKVDIAGAKALLNGATPTVKMMFPDSADRSSAFQLIQASAQQAGFTVVADASSNWGALLGSGTYDAVLFGWTLPGVGVNMVSQFYKTGAGANYNKYSNPQADALITKLQSTTTVKGQEDLRQQIDKILWNDAYGVPLYVNPGVTAYSDKVKGVVYYPGRSGAGWNYWMWSKAKA
jgi:peptide/nickel transport system substrate-binding protein